MVYTSGRICHMAHISVLLSTSLLLGVLPLACRATDGAELLAAHAGVSTQQLLAASRMTRQPPAKVVSLLQRDRSAFLSKSGAVSYACHLNSPHDEMMDASYSSSVATASTADIPAELPEVNAAFSDALDPKTAFLLHSRPGAHRKIFLQFQGCKTTGTDWNANYEVKEIITPPYNTDGQPGFSDKELHDIIIIWRGVAEHFSLWEVDVTTEDPGFEAIDRSSINDEEYGMRMCVGGNSSWTRSSIGGIATTYSFGYINAPGDGNVYRDCFVFSENLVDRSGEVNLGYVWKSISHELGHTFGLGHDGIIKGNTREEYYYPNGPTLWVPLMGVPGNGLFAQWSNGSYPPGVGAPTNTEDDIAVISASLLPLANNPGSSAGHPKVLCAHVPCSKAPGMPGTVISSVQSSLAGSSEQHFYSFTADSEDTAALISLAYTPNWAKAITKPNGNTFNNNWRISMMRLQLKFDQPDVKVEASAVDQLSTRQVFIIKLPSPGTYTFCVLPVLALDSSNPKVVLPTLYGNAGHYELIALFPSSEPPATISNQDPVTVPDVYTTAFNTTLQNLDLSGNDRDPDGDSLMVLSTTTPLYGSVERRDTSGTVDYLPWDQASNVTDTFNYNVIDGRGGASIGIVTVYIGPKPATNTTKDTPDD